MGLLDQLKGMLTPTPDQGDQQWFDFTNNTEAALRAPGDRPPKAAQLTQVLGAQGGEAAGPAYPEQSLEVGGVEPYQAPRHITRALANLRKFEGFSKIPYKDGDAYSIGYGTQENPITGQPVKPTDRAIDKDEGEMGVLKRLQEIDGRLMGKGFEFLNEGQRAGLLSFIYNVGWDAFTNSTMAGKLRENDILGAADEFDKWNKAGGKVLPGLMERRKAEKKLFMGPSSLQRALEEGLNQPVKYRIEGADSTDGGRRA